MGTVSSRNLYKFFDRDGNTLALRPDFYAFHCPGGIHVFLRGNHAHTALLSGQCVYQQFQLSGASEGKYPDGCGILNENSPEADAELVAMAVSVMRKANFQEFQVSIGHAGFFNALADEAGLSAEQRHELKELLIIKNRFGAQELVEKFRLKGNLARAIEKIPELIGDREMLEEGREACL